MALEKVLFEALDSIALSQGLQAGHYTIKIVHEHEYLYSGLERKVLISSDSGNEIHLKIKQPPTTDNFFKIPWNDCFFNNVHYYTVVQPILKTYGNVPMSPLFYRSSLEYGGEYVILEDLEAVQGYRRMRPFPGMNAQHVKEAIKMLAYFHCTIQLWKTKNPRQFKTVCSQFRPFLGPKYPYKERFSLYDNVMKDILKAVWVMVRSQGNHYHGVLQNLIPNITQGLLKALEDGSEVEEQHWTTIANCYTHTENFLFKYHTVSYSIDEIKKS